MENPVRKDRHGRTLPPRQIIVRVKDPLTKKKKKRILTASRAQKEYPDTKNVLINEDLTKLRSTVAYKARQLKNKGYVKQYWTVGGKVFIKGINDKISVA